MRRTGRAGYCCAGAAEGSAQANMKMLSAIAPRELRIDSSRLVRVVPLLRLDAGGRNHLAPARGFGLVVFGERGDRAADAPQVVIAEIFRRLRRLQVLVDRLVPPLSKAGGQPARAVNGKPGGRF